MSKKQHPHGDSATDKKRKATKHHPKNGVIDGVGRAGGSSGTGVERAHVDYIGEISGINVRLDPNEIPMSDSTGRGVHSAGHAGHTAGDRSGKNRGNSTETEPGRSGDELDQ